MDVNCHLAVGSARALLLLLRFYTIHSEIQLCEQITYNMLFRWFLEMQPSERVWTPEVFSMNRQRFEEHGFARTFARNSMQPFPPDELQHGC